MTDKSASGSLCVLITNTSFSQRTGSELYVRDLALALQRLGHAPVVYSPRLGPLAAELRARAIPVVDDLQSLGRAPDLIHGQHHLETMTALAMFPGTPALYACHGCLPWQEAAPVHPRILHYLAVNDAVRDRLVFEAGVSPDKITIALNFVDLEQFRPRPALPARPAKALIFSNYASEANYVGIIRERCELRGIRLDVAGYASGSHCATPGLLLGDYDLVFARGRSAIESLAIGTAVICCDHEGMGEMVTPQNLDHLRRNNFGLRVLDRPLRADQLDEQIDRYDPESASKASALIRASAGLDLASAHIVECYRMVLDQWHASETRRNEPDGPALARYLRQTSMLASRLEKDAYDWRHGHAQLTAQQAHEQGLAAQVRQECEVLRADAAQARAESMLLATEADSLRAQSRDLHAGMQVMQEAKLLLEKEAGELRDEVAALGELAASLDKRATSLGEEANALHGDNADLRQSVARWQAEHALATGQCESLALELKQVRSEAALSRTATEADHALQAAQWVRSQEESDATHAQEVRVHEAEIARLDAALQRLQSTLTWRLHDRLFGFSPLRVVYQALLSRRLGVANKKSDPVAGIAATAPDSSVEPAQAKLACVVMGLGNPASLVDAVLSLQSQDLPVEIVVVNSGGGHPVERLRAAGIEVKIVHRPDLLYPGAVRNLGIAATTAPFISFLAADCRAEPGWVRARLERHLAGLPAVSSSVTPARPRNLWSWVSYLNLFALRMPGVPTEAALHYGVSYQRELFERFGLFNESLRSGEDSEFNRRLEGIPFEWTPEVRSAHLHPTTLASLLRDQYGRGARIAAAWERLSGRPSRRLVAASAFRRVPALLRSAWRAAEPGQRPYIAMATALMPPAIAAYSLGALKGAAPIQNPGLKAAPRPRLLALLTFHNEMRYLPDYFLNIAPHVDGIIALDDGSDDGSGEFVESQAAVMELIRLPRRQPHIWDEPRNRRLLVEAALRHGADWLVVVDADERVELDFRMRADAEMLQAEADGTLVLTAVMRELWNHADHFRCDGIWDGKRPARLFKARQDHQFDDRSLHGHWAPLNSLTESTCREADLIIYHLRMLTEFERRERQAKYQRLDPERQFQAIGYDYLTDTSELRLQRLASRREYRPLHAA